MTGFISAVRGDTVEILSDTAIYDSAGLVLGFESKVHRLPHLPAVIFTRGDVGEGERIQDAIGLIFAGSDTVDAAISTLQEHMALRRLPGLLAPLDVSIAAISETGGPMVCTFQTADFSGRQSWTLRASKRGFANGVEHVPEEHEALVIAGLGKLGVFMMTGLRKSPGASVSFPGTDNAVIGGSIELTTLSHDSVSTTTLHTWPDKIGSKLRHVPEGRAYLLSAAEFSRAIRGESAPANAPPALNRRQRKAAAALVRRAA